MRHIASSLNHLHRAEVVGFGAPGFRLGKLAMKLWKTSAARTPSTQEYLRVDPTCPDPQKQAGATGPHCSSQPQRCSYSGSVQRQYESWKFL